MSEWENITKLYKLPQPAEPVPVPTFGAAAEIQPLPGPRAVAPIKMHGRNVYGESFDPEMLTRAEREKLNPATLRRAILAVRHYAVRGYIAGLPSGGTVGFTKRRDGRVQMSIVDPTSILSSEPW